MKSSEERINLVHMRVREIKRTRDKRIKVSSGCLCVMLLSSLVTMIGTFTTRYSASDNPALYTGASLLDSSAGGYVLTAVVAFMVGVVITVSIKKYIERHN